MTTSFGYQFLISPLATHWEMIDHGSSWSLQLEALETTPRAGSFRFLHKRKSLSYRLFFGLQFFIFCNPKFLCSNSSNYTLESFCLLPH